MRSLSSLILALGLLLAVPSVGLAKKGSPLLSGYGGPGGGQQVLLGAHLLGRHGGGGGNGGGSLRAAVPASSSASGTAVGAPTAAAASPAQSSAAPAAPARGPHHRAHQRHTTPDRAPAAAAAPRRVAYPTRVDGGGGFPLSAGDVLVGMLALAAVAGMGVWLRRTAGHGTGGGAQAPS